MLTTEQLARVVRLLKGADSVELKVSVPDGDRRSAVAALDMDPLDAQIRQVVFFDTPDLPLDRHGVVVRARRVQGKAGDSVVKLRPLDPQRLPATVRKAPAFGVEVDAMPGGFVCSGSMKAKVDDAAVEDTFAGRLPLRKLFTKEQRTSSPPTPPRVSRSTTWSALGPINVLKLKFTPGELRPPARGRAVALPGRHAAARAVDQVPAHARPSRWRPSPAASSPRTGSTSSRSSRRRRAWRSTTSRASS